MVEKSRKFVHKQAIDVAKLSPVLKVKWNGKNSTNLRNWNWALSYWNSLGILLRSRMARIIIGDGRGCGRRSSRGVHRVVFALTRFAVVMGSALRHHKISKVLVPSLAPLLLWIRIDLGIEQQLASLLKRLSRGVGLTWPCLLPGMRSLLALIPLWLSCATHVCESQKGPRWTRSTFNRRLNALALAT